MPNTAPIIAMPVPGEMGAGLARVLTGHGARVLTVTEGRSPKSLDRAEAAGMESVAFEELARADIILSVVPPGLALDVARGLARCMPLRHQPLFIDLNAINPVRMREVAAAFDGTGTRVLDGSIIGAPPREGGKGPRLYVSGEDSAPALALRPLGLDIRETEGGLGAASALKMCYGAMTKGLTGLMAAMLMAAEREGAGAALHAEMAESRADLLKWGERALPEMYAKAYRWIDEMEQISEFLGERPEAQIWRGLAGLYGDLAADHVDDGPGIAAIGSFLARS